MRACVFLAQPYAEFYVKTGFGAISSCFAKLLTLLQPRISFFRKRLTERGKVCTRKSLRRFDQILERCPSWPKELAC